MLAGGCDAVVAAPAAAQYLSMINEYHGFPGVGAVAVLAHGGRLNVRWVFSGCVEAVVAAGAVAHNAAVIEHRRHPGR